MVGEAEAEGGCVCGCVSRGTWKLSLEGFCFYCEIGGKVTNQTERGGPGVRGYGEG